MDGRNQENFSGKTCNRFRGLQLRRDRLEFRQRASVSNAQFFKVRLGYWDGRRWFLVYTHMHLKSQFEMCDRMCIISRLEHHCKWYVSGECTAILRTRRRENRINGSCPPPGECSCAFSVHFSGVLRPPGTHYFLRRTEWNAKLKLLQKGNSKAIWPGHLHILWSWSLVSEIPRLNLFILFYDVAFEIQIRGNNLGERERDRAIPFRFLPRRKPIPEQKVVYFGDGLNSIRCHCLLRATEFRWE